MPKRIVNAKIACVDFNLNKERLQMGVQVLVTDPSKLDSIQQRHILWVVLTNTIRESDIAKEHISLILKSGANVILTTKVFLFIRFLTHHNNQGIDDMCMKYFVEAGAMAVRRVKKEDMRHIAKATGGF